MTKTMRLWAALGMTLLMAGMIAGCGAAVGAESLALPTLAPTMLRCRRYADRLPRW